MAAIEILIELLHRIREPESPSYSWSTTSKPYIA